MVFLIGLGAFLLMNEEIKSGRTSMQQILPKYAPGKYARPKAVASN